jgi:hypothetical protein
MEGRLGREVSKIELSKMYMFVRTRFFKKSRKIIIVRNVGHCLRVIYRRRLEPAATPLWESEISQEDD